MSLVVQFEAELWQWRGDRGWHFVTLPTQAAAEIADRVPGRAGFGSVKVIATIGDSTWPTSIFPAKEAQSFVLPVKRQVRDANEVVAGDHLSVQLRVATDG